MNTTKQADDEGFICCTGRRTRAPHAGHFNGATTSAGRSHYCQAVLTTAGFESVCEALYLGKPVLMMPQFAHFEQASNALDGQRVGAGIADHMFDLDRLMRFAATYDEAVSERFRKWYSKGHSLFVTALQRVVDQSKQDVPIPKGSPRPVQCKPGTSF
ncbi:glycosyltransferase family protein [Spirosoma arboris]|nr:glycosyltransferase family protein [Spirosoma arboris]